MDLQNTTQSIIDYTQINKMIEINLGRALHNFNNVPQNNNVPTIDYNRINATIETNVSRIFQNLNLGSDPQRNQMQQPHNLSNGALDTTHDPAPAQPIFNSVCSEFFRTRDMQSGQNLTFARLCRILSTNHTKMFIIQIKIQTVDKGKLIPKILVLICDNRYFYIQLMGTKLKHKTLYGRNKSLILQLARVIVLVSKITFGCYHVVFPQTQVLIRIRLLR